MDTSGIETCPAADALASCRERINRIDGVLLALLRERLLTAIEAAKAKAQLGQPVFAPPREAEVLARITALATAPLEGDSAQRIFAAIIEETRATEVAGTGHPLATTRGALSPTEVRNADRNGPSETARTIL